MEFLCVIQAEHAVFHLPRGRKFAENECHVAAGSLDAAGSIEFGEESDEHAVSLTKPRGRMQGLVRGKFVPRVSGAVIRRKADKIPEGVEI